MLSTTAAAPASLPGLAPSRSPLSRFRLRPRAVAPPAPSSTSGASPRAPPPPSPRAQQPRTAQLDRSVRTLPAAKLAEMDLAERLGGPLELGVAQVGVPAGAAELRAKEGEAL
jgi:hypothetical protein